MKNVSLNILSFEGRTIQQENLSGNNIDIDISSLSSGIYYIDVTDGMNHSLHKLIKK